jgi:hypothetical protein
VVNPSKHEFLGNQFLPHKKHAASPLQKFMQYRETNTIYSENHLKHIKVLYKQNAEFSRWEI